MGKMCLKLILLFYISSIKCQHLQPAVLVTEDNDAVSAKKVYLGFLGCDNSSLEQTKRIEFLEKKVMILEAANIDVQTLENKISALETIIQEFNQLPIIFLRRAFRAGITGPTYSISF